MPTKKCPFCAEEIQAAAIKCKHCLTDLPAPESAPIPAPVAVEIFKDVPSVAAPAKPVDPGFLDYCKAITQKCWPYAAIVTALILLLAKDNDGFCMLSGFLFILSGAWCFFGMIFCKKRWKAIYGLAWLYCVVIFIALFPVGGPNINRVQAERDKAEKAESEASALLDKKHIAEREASVLQYKKQHPDQRPAEPAQAPEEQPPAVTENQPPFKATIVDQTRLYESVDKANEFMGASLDTKSAMIKRGYFNNLPWLYPGEKITVLSVPDANDWVNVETAEGKQGFILNNNIRPMSK